MLGQSLPGVRVSAEHYPPSTAAMAASAFVSGVRWLVLLAALSLDFELEQMLKGNKEIERILLLLHSHGMLLLH